jgi:hypothetical protein
VNGQAGSIVGTLEQMLGVVNVGQLAHVSEAGRGHEMLI